jgi:hypothetical protein
MKDSHNPVRQESSSLLFHGIINTGKGTFSNMTIPGHALLSDAPCDWPEVIHPGSLNVLIGQDGYPDELFSRCQGELVQKLDSGTFAPTFVIAGAAISKNRLQPTPEIQRKGDAQVWRAQIHNRDNGQAVACWVLRRIGSARKDGLEVVASERLRDRLNLADGTHVTLELYGHWENS